MGGGQLYPTSRPPPQSQYLESYRQVIHDGIKIPQLDGLDTESTLWNDSLISSSSSEGLNISGEVTDGQSEFMCHTEHINPNHISVITGHRPSRIVSEPRIKYLRIIRRTKGETKPLAIPNIAIYNHRSVWKKF